MSPKRGQRSWANDMQKRSRAQQKRPLISNINLLHVLLQQHRVRRLCNAGRGRSRECLFRQARANAVDRKTRSGGAARSECLPWPAWRSGSAIATRMMISGAARLIINAVRSVISIGSPKASSTASKCPVRIPDRTHRRVNVEKADGLACAFHHPAVRAIETRDAEFLGGVEHSARKRARFAGRLDPHRAEVPLYCGSGVPCQFSIRR